MGALVESQPHTELCRPELMGSLQSEHVGTHQGHHVAGPAGGQHQLVLPEHPASQHPEQGSHLHSDQTAGEPSAPTTEYPAAGHTGCDSLLGGAQQVGEESDVALHPLDAAHDDHLRPSPAPQSGLVLDQPSRPAHELGGLLLQQPQVIATVEVVAPRHPARHSHGQRPGDSGLHLTTR